MRYKGLDLNLLHVLDVMLEVKNVTRAADRLALSQSAVSAALARLRDFFGDDLFVLDGRRMLPTAFAEQLAANLHLCLQGADTLISTGKDFEPAISKRTFRIIAADYIFASVLTDLSESISRRAPGIKLDFVGAAPDSGERLDGGEIDVMIGPRDYLSHHHPVEPLFDEEVVVAGWRRNPVLAEPVTQDAFFEAGHIAVRHGRRGEATFAERYIDSVGRSRRIEAVAPAFTVVPWMLVGTTRLALMPRRLADKVSQYIPLKYAPSPFSFPPIQELGQFHRAKAADKGLRWLIEEIRRIAG
jgi:LysR family transcriptional regulator, nod-box dependent transcriptional activator